MIFLPILRTKEIIENNISSYVESMESKYTKFLDTRPNFVTYYSKDIVYSTHDMGLQNVEKDIGEFSPNKYNVISDLPIYGLGELAPQLQMADSGLDTNITGDCVILQGSIKPLPDDLFIVPYLNKKYLFKVTSVTPDAVKTKPSYKVEFIFTRIIDNENEISGSFLERYNFVYENIGSNNIALLENKKFLLTESILKLKEKLINLFVAFYYNTKLNSIVLNYKGNYVYNRYLTNFIAKNNLLAKANNISDTIYLVDVFSKETDIEFTLKYKRTIYEALEKRDSRVFKDNLYFMNCTELKHSQFKMNGINQIYFLDFTDNPCCCECNGNFDNIQYVPKNLFNRIKSDLYHNNLNKNVMIIENNIIGFINNSEEYENVNETFINAVNKMDFNPSFISYVLLPILIYILDQSYKKLYDNFDHRVHVI